MSKPTNHQRSNRHRRKMSGYRIGEILADLADLEQTLSDITLTACEAECIARDLRHALLVVYEAEEQRRVAPS